MAATVAGILLTGTHGSRPSSGVSVGTLYSCTTHSLIYQTSDTGSTWATWATLTGTGLSDPMTTRGDMIYRNASNVSDRLALPAAGQVIGRSGSDLGAIYPPGYEFNYTEITTSVTVNQTTEGTAVTVVTSGSVTYSGSDIVMIEFFCPRVDTSSTSASAIVLLIYEDSTLLGRIGLVKTQAANADFTPVFCARRRTPSNAAHTFTVKAYSTAGTDGAITCGSGGAGVELPAYVRIIKV